MTIICISNMLTPSNIFDIQIKVSNNETILRLNNAIEKSTFLDELHDIDIYQLPKTKTLLNIEISSAKVSLTDTI